MTVLNNKRVTLVKRPSSKPALEHFKIDEQQIDTDSLQDGEIIVETKFGSVDPYLYMGMGRPETPDVIPNKQGHGLTQFKDSMPIDLGDSFGGRGAGIVIASKHDKIKAGDLVAADWRWQQYAKFNVDKENTFETLENDIFGESGVSLSVALGALSVSGAHALWGYEYLQLKEGQTIAISAAGGNIGTIVGQYAKAHGVTVLGIAGGAEKCEALKKELGYDAVVDYRQAGDDANKLAELIKQAAPQGIDGYFDNVGGVVTEGVNANVKENGRVYMCGKISAYPNGENVALDEKSKELYAKKNITAITCMQADYISKVKQYRQKLFPFIKDGRVKPIEWVTQGVENAPQAFVDLYQGKNYGKAIIKF